MIPTAYIRFKDGVRMLVDGLDRERTESFVINVEVVRDGVWFETSEEQRFFVPHSNIVFVRDLRGNNETTN